MTRPCGHYVLAPKGECRFCDGEAAQMIGIGVAAKQCEEAKDSIKYRKDEQGVLHVSKRKLRYIIHYNWF